jgi:hypothetical protein
MSDTPDQISKIQLEIFLKKSEEERLKIGDEFSSFGRTIVESSIRNDKPEISEIELKIEVFKRCYSDFFSAEEMGRIVTSMREYLSGSKF